MVVAVALTLAILLPLGAWLGAVILRVETPNGTLVVEMNDDQVEARVKGGRLILAGTDGKTLYTLSPSERSKELPAGSYKVRVEGADGLALDTEEFTLKKGGRVKVRVRMARQQAAAIIQKKFEVKDLSLADPFQPKSVWEDSNGVKKTLTVTERTGNRFQGRFVVGPNIDREINGTVKDGKVSWLAKDVRAIKGAAGHDNEGTITKDGAGYLINFVYSRTGKPPLGTFTLRLLPDK